MMPERPQEGESTDGNAAADARRERYRLHRTEHPGIYRRGERFVVVWRHRGRQYKKTYATLKEALAAKARHRAGATRPGEPGALLLRNYARDWVESYPGSRRRGITDNTRDSYRYSLERYILPTLGSTDIRALRPRDIRALVRDLEDTGLAPASVERHLAPLKALCATAYDDGDIDRDPAFRVRISGRNRPAEATAPRALNAEEIRRLLEQLEAPWDLLAEFLIHTGLRISEAIALTWADLDLGEEPTVHVRRRYFRGQLGQPKSRNSIRKVPLSPSTTEKLRALRDAREGQPPDLVFPSTDGGYLDPHNLRSRVIRPAARAAGIGRVSPHMFRHTCASLLFEHGRNIKQVQEWLGHHDASITLRVYIHLVDRGVGDAAFFDQITGPQSPH